MGLTRGETQGTSLALFYRFFAFVLLAYAMGILLLVPLLQRTNTVTPPTLLNATVTPLVMPSNIDAKSMMVKTPKQQLMAPQWLQPFRIRSTTNSQESTLSTLVATSSATVVPSTTCTAPSPCKVTPGTWSELLLGFLRRGGGPYQQQDSSIKLLLWQWTGKFMYIAFYLVVHLMKLHSLSLIWGVTTEAMEYEEMARHVTNSSNARGSGGKENEVKLPENHKTRLQRLSLIGFGGTLGGILGR
jgi:hypothetical protein